MKRTMREKSEKSTVKGNLSQCTQKFIQKIHTHIYTKYTKVWWAKKRVYSEQPPSCFFIKECGLNIYIHTMYYILYYEVYTYADNIPHMHYNILHLVAVVSDYCYNFVSIFSSRLVSLSLPSFKKSLGRRERHGEWKKSLWIPNEHFLSMFSFFLFYLSWYYTGKVDL